MRPCYVPRADQFYFEGYWLAIKGRELDALRFGNALWWLGEASWNESFDAREVYGNERAIFGMLSRTLQREPPGDFQQARMLYLEEKDEPFAPALIGVQVAKQRGFFYVKRLSRGKLKDPGGGLCWGELVIREQRPLTVAEAQPALECARRLMEDRVRAEPWRPLPEEGRDVHYLVEYQDASFRGLVQRSSLVSNIDGVKGETLLECHRIFQGLSRMRSVIPPPVMFSG
ncbi:MAG: hypothetical protein NZX77_12450 [Polyangiaceae bacterium]|nr:hypothetical protein [Polyangiaceae bacterium]